MIAKHAEQKGNNLRALHPLLSVTDLSVRFATEEGDVTAVNALTFAVEQGETLGIVG